MNKPWPKVANNKKRVTDKFWTGDNGVPNKTMASMEKSAPLLFIHERFSALISVGIARNVIVFQHA